PRRDPRLYPTRPQDPAYSPATTICCPGQSSLSRRPLLKRAPTIAGRPPTKQSAHASVSSSSLLIADHSIADCGLRIADSPCLLVSLLPALPLPPPPSPPLSMSSS